MNFNSRDLISISDLSGDSSRAVALAFRGRRIVVMDGGRPVAAIIGIADLETLAELSDGQT